MALAKSPENLIPPSAITGTSPAPPTTIHDRGQLRHAHARDDAGGADAARPDADLDRIRARVDQRARAVRRGDVARADLYLVRILILDAADGDSATPSE